MGKEVQGPAVLVGPETFWNCTLSDSAVGTRVHRSPLQLCICCGLLTLAAESVG